MAGLGVASGPDRRHGSPGPRNGADGPDDDLTGERLRAVFDHAPLGICAVDVDGRVLSANPALRRMLGLAPDAGRPALADLVHPDDAGLLRAAQRRLALGEMGLLAIERRFRGPDGSLFWGRLTATLVDSDSRDGRFVVAMLENVEDRRRLEAAIEEVNARIEALSRVKSALVASVSHEFRTALTGIGGLSELMRDGELDAAEVRELAADISSEAHRLGRLIADMLDLDRLESGSTSLRIRPVDVNAMLTTLAGRVRRTFAGRRVTLRLDHALPPLQADSDRLTQVFSNLLSNAVKYSPSESSISVMSRGIDGGVRVAVRDHGPGVPANALELIFDRHVRLERETLSSVVGSGLGLPIVREIVRLHGGRVWGGNASNGGAVFTVELPLTTPEDVHAHPVL
jgi:PAS domain S-box-containing protein